MDSVAQLETANLHTDPPTILKNVYILKNKK
jgi:hypothetical protein